MADEVLFERRGHIAWITLNRPHVHNAMNPDLMRQLREAFLAFRQERELRVAVVTGAGDRAFSAGADLKGLARRAPQDFLQEFWYSSERGQPECWKPVIAAINGYCYAAAMNLVSTTCDIRIASEQATFCYAEVLRGFSGYAASVAVLPRQIPYALALEWLMTGRVVDAQEAYRAGYVCEVVPHQRLLARAQEVAEQVAALAPLATRAVKESAWRALNLDVPRAIRMAAAIGTLSRLTEDAREGPRAFAEKRAPQYRGR
mgnify:CR=1 FL=1